MLLKGKKENKQSYVATIGFFDGVHRGHRYLIQQVKQIAAERSLLSAVVTFPEHPRKVMHADYSPQLLTSFPEKQRLLEATGINRCFILPFTTQLSLYSAKEFMQLLRDKYAISVLVIGYDHRFGHNRAEGFDDYLRYGQELGMEVLPARAFPDFKVSSSVVRGMLNQGRLDDVYRDLGYYYMLSGEVVHGHQVGSKIGFPTANLQLTDTDKLIPADGVYAVRVMIDGQSYGGMLGLGHRPTLNNGTDRTIEVHIFDFQKDIYHSFITLSLIAYTRPILDFKTLQELTQQLHRDEQQIRQILEQSAK